MTKSIDTKKPVYFYDDRNKTKYLLEMTKILFEDDKKCLCEAEFAGDSLIYEILFNKKNGEVKVEDFDSWYATNEVMDKERLFHLLLKLGFESESELFGDDNEQVVFKKDKEIFIFPYEELQERHYITTRKQLDMNGHINEKEFNKMFPDKI